MTSKKLSGRLLLCMPYEVGVYGEGWVVGHASEDETGRHTGGCGPRLPALVPATKT